MPLKPSNIVQAMVSPRAVRRVVQTSKSEGTESSSNEHYRVVVLGLGGVGKSAIAKQLRQKRSSTKSRHCSDEMHHIQYTESGYTATIELLDTSDYQNFPAMRDLAIRQGHAFILVCSVDMEDSFEQVKNLRHEILRIKQSQNPAARIPIVVVANKTDLPKCNWSLDLAYAELLVHCDWGDCGFVACSALSSVCFRPIISEMQLQIVSSNMCEHTVSAVRHLRRQGSVPNLLDVPSDLIRRTPSFPRKKKLERPTLSAPERENVSRPQCHVQ